MVEGESRDEDEIKCGESVQYGDDGIFWLEDRNRPSERDSLEDENDREVEKKDELDEANLLSRRRDVKTRGYGHKVGED